MDFIEIRPSKVRGNSSKLRETVRASFTSLKSKANLFSLSVYIGKDIADKMKIKQGDKVSIFHDRQDERIWMIKKTNSVGYKLLDTRSTSPALKFQLTWRLFKPEQKEFGMRELKIIESDEEKIIVDAKCSTSY